MSEQFSTDLKERIDRKMETTGEKREAQLQSVQERIREHVRWLVKCLFLLFVVMWLCVDVIEYVNTMVSKCWKCWPAWSIIPLVIVVTVIQENWTVCAVLCTQNYCVSFFPRCMECRRGLAMRILSVHLSVKCVLCDKVEERSVQIFISCERSFSLVFWEEEWLVGGDPLYLKFWVSRPPLEQIRRCWTNNRS